MKIILEINNQAKKPIVKNFLETVIKKTAENCGYDFLHNKNISISLAVISKAEIKKINKTYRGANKETDILSFCEYKNKKQIQKVSGKNIFLGELILCYDDIKDYSQKEKIIFRKELAKVVSHGTLHLLGFKHGKKMFDIQENIGGNL